MQNARARHCGDCAHARAGTAGATRRWLTLGLAGSGLTMIGVIVVWLSLIAGAICLLAGGLSVVLAYLRVRRDAIRVRAALPVPLYPKVTDIELAEELRGEITLGSPGGDYQTVLQPVEGTVSMCLTFGRPDRDRVWRRPKRLRSETSGMRYCAGCLLLLGPFGIKEGEEVSGPALSLDGDVKDYPVFRSQDPPSASKWNFARGYELRARPDISGGPVWIIPSIVPESDRHTLELDVQWVEFGPDEDHPIVLDMIELLRLEYPVSWGDVHSWAILQKLRAQPRAVSALTADGRQSLELKPLSPAKPEKNDQAHKPTRLTLSIRFGGQIEPDDEISGRLTATMLGTLSGITGVRLFSSLGELRGYTGTASIKTRIDANFRLSLASIRYQASRVVPDRAAEDSDRDSYADDFAVVPGDETVIALTNAMSEEGYYVKHVIENPPRSGKRADLVQRYWDIAGRRYEGVYPIDFHIILTGEEVHTGDIRPERGTTKVRIVVKGAYTDDEMDTRIGDEWKRLHELTQETLRRKDAVTGDQA